MHRQERRCIGVHTVVAMWLCVHAFGYGLDRRKFMVSCDSLIYGGGLLLRCSVWAMSVS
jgi:hypothetical protein